MTGSPHQRAYTWLEPDEGKLSCPVLRGGRSGNASSLPDFDRLAERVKAVVGEDPLGGHLFVFRSRRGDRLPKHPMAEAINYALGQWAELNAFCSDGEVPIDNNVSEREMKRVVLNRKNSLFVGNPRGGRTAAILTSLTSTCRRHDVDPQLYLTQLLTNLPQLRLSQLPQWLPDQWKLQQAARLRDLHNPAIPPA